MAIKSFGNALASFRYRFGRTTGPIVSPSPSPAESSGITATGGSVIPEVTAGNGYKYHVFTVPGSFDISNISGPGIFELLVVGGGGSGSKSGGGGGAGGAVFDNSFPGSVTTYTISIGAGGDWTGSPSCSGGSSGVPGTPTTFTAPGPVSVTAIGGGGGAYCPDAASASGVPAPQPAGSGGCGGGNGRVNPTAGTGYQPAITHSGTSPSVINYGNNGGAPAPLVPGGGGGGIGSSGGDNGVAGSGYPFSQFPSSIIAPAIPAPIRPTWSPTVTVSGYYGGGGAGGGYPDPGIPGGLGGGGASADPGGDGVPGMDFTGGGGGSGGYTGSPGAGGSGGNGIVLIRYRN